MWNEFTLAAGAERPPTPSFDMDILTILLSGRATRTGSLGGTPLSEPGSLHLLSAGTGAEVGIQAAGDEPARFHEIWLVPDKLGAPPTCDVGILPEDRGFEIVASGFPADRKALRLRSRTRIVAARLAPGETLDYAIGNNRYSYAVSLSGSIHIGDIELTQGGGVAVRDEKQILITAIGEAHVILVDTRA